MEVSLNMLLKQVNRGVPWWLVVRVPGFHSCGRGSIPERGTGIPKATQLSKNKKRERELIKSSLSFQLCLME